MKLLIKYPTRGRGQLFISTMNNIAHNVGNIDYRVLVSADLDDSINYEQIIEGFGIKNRIILKRGKSLSKIHAVNRDMEEMLNWDWQWLIVMSDDMKFIEKNTIPKMLDLIKSKWNDTDFFAHFSDQHTRHRLCTMSVMGREYYERFFYIYAPCYGNIQCDGEAQFVAMMLDKYFYFDSKLIEHQHCMNVLDVAIDDTYNLHSNKGHRDIEIYNKRKKKLFYVNNPVNIPFNSDGSWEGELR